MNCIVMTKFSLFVAVCLWVFFSPFKICVSVLVIFGARNQKVGGADAGLVASFTPLQLLHYFLICFFFWYVVVKVMPLRVLF